jgi:LPXTG-motif cell wall-anchored protein
VRKFLATTAMVGILGSMAAIGLGAPVGAQTQLPPPICTFTAVAGSTTSVPTTITVSGTAPADTVVTVRLNGGNPKTATSASAPTANAPWGPVTYDITAPGTYEITVQLPGAYGSAFCLGPNNQTVIPITVAAATAALPRTGSDTSQYVLAALALIGVGAIFVIGARRRRSVSTHV